MSECSGKTELLFCSIRTVCALSVLIRQGIDNFTRHSLFGEDKQIEKGRKNEKKNYFSQSRLIFITYPICS